MRLSIKAAAAVATYLLIIPQSFAAIILYTASLSGPAEAPPNSSPGTGFSTVTIDTIAHTMLVTATFSGLLTTTSTGAPSSTTASHIHCCTAAPVTGTAAVATETPTFSSFPIGVTAGSFSQSYNLLVATTYNSPFLAANPGGPAAAEAALIAGLDSGRAYLNIHSTAFPGGEIRGFLARVPEPGSLALLALGALGFLARRKRA